MARTKTSTVVAMEVFVEKHEVAPVGIVLELIEAPSDGTPPILAAEKNASKTF